MDPISSLKPFSENNNLYIYNEMHISVTHIQIYIYNMCILYNIVTKRCNYIQYTILYTSIYTIAQIYSVTVGSEKCHEFLVLLPVASQHPLPSFPPDNTPKNQKHLFTQWMGTISMILAKLGVKDIQKLKYGIKK